MNGKAFPFSDCIYLLNNEPNILNIILYSRIVIASGEPKEQVLSLNCKLFLILKPKYVLNKRQITFRRELFVLFVQLSE